jgi:hypothetical protein
VTGIIKKIYDFQVGLGYVSVLNFFGKGNPITTPKTTNNTNNINTGNNNPVF